jgi:hypothetical protein
MNCRLLIEESERQDLLHLCQTELLELDADAASWLVSVLGAHCQLERRVFCIFIGVAKRKSRKGR